MIDYNEVRCGLIEQRKEVDNRLNEVLGAIEAIDKIIARESIVMKPEEKNHEFD